VKGGAGALEFGAPMPLFSIPIVADQVISAFAYDVMLDGERFLVLAPTREGESPLLHAILNWEGGLAAK
jgi:hypothetical protein